MLQQFLQGKSLSCVAMTDQVNGTAMRGGGGGNERSVRHIYMRQDITEGCNVIHASVNGGYLWEDEGRNLQVIYFSILGGFVSNFHVIYFDF